MPYSLVQTRVTLKRYASLVTVGRAPIIVFLVLYVAVSLIYFRQLFYLGNLDFPDLGVFPLYPVH